MYVKFALLWRRLNPEIHAGVTQYIVVLDTKVNKSADKKNDIGNLGSEIHFPGRHKAVTCFEPHCCVVQCLFSFCKTQILLT